MIIHFKPILYLSLFFPLTVILFVALLFPDQNQNAV